VAPRPFTRSGPLKNEILDPAGLCVCYNTFTKLARAELRSRLEGAHSATRSKFVSLSVDSTPVNGQSLVTFMLSFIRNDADNVPQYYNFCVALRQMVGGSKVVDYFRMLKETMGAFGISTPQEWQKNNLVADEARLFSAAADKGRGAIDALRGILGNDMVSPDPAHGLHNLIGTCIKRTVEVACALKQLKPALKRAKQSSKMSEALEDAGVEGRAPALYEQRWGYSSIVASWVLRNREALTSMKFVDVGLLEAVAALDVVFKPIVSLLSLVQLQAPCDTITVLYACTRAYVELLAVLETCKKDVKVVAWKLCQQTLAQFRRRFFNGIVVPHADLGVRSLESAGDDDKTFPGCLLDQKCILAMYALSPFSSFTFLVEAQLVSESKAMALQTAALDAAWTLSQLVSPGSFKPTESAATASRPSPFASSLFSCSSTAVDPKAQFAALTRKFANLDPVVAAFAALDQAYAKNEVTQLVCVTLMQDLLRAASTKEFSPLSSLLTALLGTTLKSVSNETAHSLLEYVTHGRRSRTSVVMQAAYLYARTIPRALMLGRPSDDEKKKAGAVAKHDAMWSKFSAKAKPKAEPLASSTDEVLEPDENVLGDAPPTALPASQGAAASAATLPLQHPNQAARRSNRQGAWTAVSTLIQLIGIVPRTRKRTAAQANLASEQSSDDVGSDEDDKEANLTDFKDEQSNGEVEAEDDEDDEDLRGEGSDGEGV